MEKVSIVIPACNEEQSVGALIDEIREEMKCYEYEIVVVDDGSSDSTAKIAREKDVLLIQHPAKRGYGASLKTGIRKAKYDIIVITDADGTYPVSEMPRLIEHMREYDMVVGARNKHNIPLMRRPAKFVLNLLANYLTDQNRPGMKIPDLNSGLRVFKKDIALKFSSLLPNGFSFTTTITLAMLTNDYLVKFIPIDYLQRQGKSKIRPIRDTWNFATLIIRTVMYFNPLRIFIPLSLILVSIALVVFSYSKFVLGKVMDISVIVILMSAVQVVAIGLIADLIDKRSQR